MLLTAKARLPRITWCLLPSTLFHSTHDVGHGSKGTRQGNQKSNGHGLLRRMASLQPGMGGRRTAAGLEAWVASQCGFIATVR